MLCRRCGVPNAEEKEFCRQCGASLHWQAVASAEGSPDRQGVAGLIVGGVVLVAGLLFAYGPWFTQPATSGQVPTQASASPVLALPTTVTPGTVTPERRPQPLEPLTTPAPANPASPSRSGVSQATPATPTLAPSGLVAVPAQTAGLDPPNVQPASMPVTVTLPMPSNSSVPGLQPPVPSVAANVGDTSGFLQAAGPFVSEGKEAYAGFMQLWADPAGPGALLRQDSTAANEEAVVHAARKAQLQIADAATGLRQLEAGPAEGPLKESLVAAFSGAVAALGRAAEPSQYGSPAAIDAIVALLTRADQDIVQATAATSVRPAGRFAR